MPHESGDEDKSADILTLLNFDIDFAFTWIPFFKT